MFIEGIGKDSVLSNRTIYDAEVFVCKVYGAMKADNINDVRSSMFVKGTTVDKLPPTRDCQSTFTLSALTIRLWYGGKPICRTRFYLLRNRMEDGRAKFYLEYGGRGVMEDDGVWAPPLRFPLHP